jgi:hypothetical protein
MSMLRAMPKGVEIWVLIGGSWIIQIQFLETNVSAYISEANLGLTSPATMR